MVLGKEAGLLGDAGRWGGLVQRLSGEEGPRRCWPAGFERSLNAIHKEGMSLSWGAGGETGRPEESFSVWCRKAGWCR